MRRAHLLRAVTSSEFPSNCIWFDTETHPDPTYQGKGERHVLTFGWAIYRRIERGEWTAPEYHRFVSVVEFWEWVWSKSRPKTRLYLFCHNAAFDVPVVDAFGVLRGAGWQLTKAVVDSPPVILAWRKDKVTIQLVDTLNIWRMALAKVGEQIGLPKLAMPAATASREEWDAYGKRDVEIIAAACVQWFVFLKANALGGFAPTLAAQALRAYRHRFMDCKILMDDNEDAAALSREALHGGRVECFRLGAIGEPVHVLDINSMYPAVMRETPMPTRLLLYTRHAEPAELIGWLDRFAVVAEVDIECRAPWYGVVHDGRLIFPIGRFRAALTTPDLARAVARGEVRRVHRAAVYEQAVIFAGFVDALYKIRMQAQGEGNGVMSWLAKILMNSLYGKFGQKGRVYETVGDWPDDSIAVWEEVDADTGRSYKLRRYAGIVQQLSAEPESRESFPAIAAHVTAAARSRLNSLIHGIPTGQIHYVDTDSLFVSAAGAQALQAHIDQKQLGALKLVGVYGDVEIFGPKDYRLGDKKVIKGVKCSAVWTGAASVTQPQFSSLIGLLRAGDLSAPIVKTVAKELRREYRKGRVQPDGSVLPLIIDAA